jgi:hypothetical protein
LVTKFGTVPIRPFASALAALNNDQLQDGLGDFNAAALTSDRPLGIATSNLLRIVREPPILVNQSSLGQT